MFTIKRKNEQKFNSKLRIYSKTNNLIRKLQQALLITAIGLTFASCKSEDTINPPPANSYSATFTSTIANPSKDITQTRAAGTTWHSGDQIGIFAIKTGEDLKDESLYNNYSNLKFINQTAGEVARFIAADNDILYPPTGQKIDFIAYYPYIADITEYTFPIDLTQQEPQSNIDVMYATATGHSYDNPNVELKFSRILSQLQIILSSEEGLELQDAAVTFENSNIRGIVDLADGSVTSDTTQKTVTPIIVFNSEENRLIASAILLPGQELSDINIKVELVTGESYSYTPNEYKLTAQTSRIYILNLTKEDVELVDSGSTIEDWHYDSDETVYNLKPNTKDSPDNPKNPDNSDSKNVYTVTEALSMTTGLVWVEGYIVGFVSVNPVGSNTRAVETDPTLTGSDKSIILSDNITITEPDQIFPIELANIDIESPLYKDLNLKDNNHIIGQKVKILCKISRYKGGVGSTEVVDYQLL
jgi:hypothetical protein